VEIEPRSGDAKTFDPSGYWYEQGSEERATAVLNALRRYRQAEKDMRARTQTSMQMGETDLAAIRFLLRAQRRGTSVSAKELAGHLGITTASTSVLINRLVKSGHLERHAHPTDRRGVLITATDGSDEEVRATLAGMHARMIAAAERLGPEEARAVVDFLRSMTEAVDRSEA
jgi:DNA-binding MarR family transcriptional regulator